MDLDCISCFTHIALNVFAYMYVLLAAFKRVPMFEVLFLTKSFTFSPAFFSSCPFVVSFSVFASLDSHTCTD